MKIYIANYDIGSMTPGQESRHQHMLGRQLLQTALSREGISGAVCVDIWPVWEAFFAGIAEYSIQYQSYEGVGGLCHRHSIPWD